MKPETARRMQLLLLSVMLPGSIAWLVSPFALWQAFGVGFTILWLLPTGIVVFAMVALKRLPGGG